MTDVKRWAVTGAAGFIGSHLVETLLKQGQIVTGLDDLSSGTMDNLKGAAQSSGFHFIEGDIRQARAVTAALEGADYVLHHAAIGSVMRSIEEPEFVESVNVGGFQTILDAAQKAGVARVIYASSSAVYGDGGEAPRREDMDLSPKSPYAEGKIQNERDAAGAPVDCIGLRYFNIYGARQDPNGAYAAVIPKWIDVLRGGEVGTIFGDGETVRDFCHVSDVAAVNILAALSDNGEALNGVYNIGSGQATTLNDLYHEIAALVGQGAQPAYEPFRQGDIRVSCADIGRAQSAFGFTPSVMLTDGLRCTIEAPEG